METQDCYYISMKEAEKIYMIKQLGTIPELSTGVTMARCTTELFLVMMMAL